ncbi:MAG: HU family DNA-binding protein [Azoarcus sp.]|jgi:predicted histone-like DNA-binding protein|nr:HU family DNA-binding protein [Azoarcus sp.]
MAVKLKKIARQNPQNREETRYYLVQENAGMIDLKDLAAAIEKQTAMTRADVTAVLVSLADVLPGYLKEGKSVRFGDLGSFRISVSSEGMASEAALSARHVKGAKIVFTPAVELKASIAKLSYSIAT